MSDILLYYILFGFFVYHVYPHSIIIRVGKLCVLFTPVFSASRTLSST